MNVITRWPAPGSWTPSRSSPPAPSGRTPAATTRPSWSTGTTRHIVTDVLGRLVLNPARTAMPSIVVVWAGGGYAGKLLAFAQYVPADHHADIVKRTDKRPDFEVLPRRWVVERTLSWLMPTRRPAGNDERLPAHAEAMVKWSMIGVMTRRLAPAPGRRPWQPSTAG